MDNSNSSSSHAVKAKLTLLDWFERQSRKRQRTDHEAQRTKQRTNLNDNSSEDPAGCSHWSGEPGELVVETPLAKRVRGDHADDCIAIDSNSDIMIFIMMRDRGIYLYAISLKSSQIQSQRVKLSKIFWGHVPRPP